MHPSDPSPGAGRPTVSGRIGAPLLFTTPFDAELTVDG